jgi:hypothetical protein
MTHATTHASSRISIVANDKLITASVAVTVAVSAAAVEAGVGGGATMASLASLVALAGVAIGHLLGRQSGGVAKSAAGSMVRIADELVQYRAFTRLLRDQGDRVIESTNSAATMIVAGLSEMEAAVDRMRMLADRVATDDGAELRALVEAVDIPVLAMLGHLQFQDVTQQQIAFLSRLSLMLDDHMGQLSRQLGERRAIDRVGRFKDMFDQALGDCVMDSQRDDHHAASGLDLREAASSKFEMF